MSKQQRVMDVVYSAMLWTNNECLEHHYIGTNGGEVDFPAGVAARHLYFLPRYKPENCVVLVISFS